MTITRQHIIMAFAALAILFVAALTTPPADCTSNGCRYAILR